MRLPIEIVSTHVAIGAIALCAGAAALAFRKGSRPHVLAGRTFVASMAIMLLSAAVMTILLGRTADLIGIVFFLYLVLTAWMTVRSRGVPGSFERVAIAIPVVCAPANTYLGVLILQQPPGTIPPAGLLFFLAFLCLIAAVGDFRYLLRGSLTNTAKLSRHIWRLCMAFLAASGSFFLGQAKVLPDNLRQPELLVILALAPFGFMVFWLIRIRVGRYSTVVAAKDPVVD